MNKKSLFKRTLSSVLAASVATSGLTLPTFAAGDDEISLTKVSNDKISASLTRREEFKGIEKTEPVYSENEQVRVSIVLENKSAVQQGYSLEKIGTSTAAANYRSKLKAEQDSVAAKIEQATGEKLDVVWNITLAANMISANVKFGQIETIKKISGVKDVLIETRYEPQVADTDIPTDPNMSTSSTQIGSTAAWAEGYTGAGSKVAVIDTGIDFQHISFDGDALMYSFEQNAKKENQTTDDYVAGLDLLDKDDLKTLAAQLNISKNLDPEMLYISEKIPFAYNYVDENYNIDHEHDTQGEHGSHVEGIAAANAYVKSSDGTFKSALNEVHVQGVAPDAQILTMKVFGNAGGAYDSDYMVAIEDAIVLGADSINLSLGSGNPGMSSHTNKEYQAIMEDLVNHGAVVCMSAGNSGHWAENVNNLTHRLYLDDVSMQTDGSPGSYTNSLASASVDNIGVTGEYFDVGGSAIFYNAASLGDTFSTIASDEAYDYVLIDGFGTEEDWAAVGDALKGKIAVCSRGSTSFFEKANAAIAAGAIATIIYNNQPGTISINAEGYLYNNPLCSITQADGALMKSKATADASGKFYVGKMVVAKGVGSALSGAEYYTMSDFSSWGVPGSLELKPEITSPGGNIYSVFGSNGEGSESADHKSYENMSGTSMASPQTAGMAAVVAEYIRENDLEEKTGLSQRVLIQSLLMSTAEPMIQDLGENGTAYYSVLQQGAGLANVGNAIKSPTYVLMGEDATASYKDGKVKAELGDDPERKNEYTFSFTLNNLTNEEKTYALSADLFTQAPFKDYANLSGEDTCLYMDTSTTALQSTAVFTVGGATVTEAVVPADGSVEISVTLKIDDEDKADLDKLYTAGAYIEGYVFATPKTTAEGEEGVIHSIPVLGYYGSWTEPSMFEVGTYLERYYGKEVRLPYLPVDKTNYFTLKFPDGEYYALGNPYVDDEHYDESRNAINSVNGTEIGRIAFSAIRNAANSLFSVYDVTTGEYLAQEEMNSVDGAFYYTNRGQWMSYQYETGLNFAPTGAAEGDQIICSFTLAPEYYVGEDGKVAWDELEDGASISMPFVIDNTAPKINRVDFNEETGELTVVASDNRYIAAINVTNKAGNVVLQSEGGKMDAKPGEESTYTFKLGEMKFPNVLIQVADYAMNASTYALNDVTKVEAPEMLAYNCDTGSWTVFDRDSGTSDYAPNDKEIIAATAVDHIIFGVDQNGVLYSAPDNDITDLTVVNDLGITVNDLAYNPVDGNIYGISVYNDTTTALFDIDKLTGEWGEKVMVGIPLTNTLACDDEGNFYFNVYGDTTIAKCNLTTGKISPVYMVRELGASRFLQAMEWDSERDLLCWAACSSNGPAYYEIDFSGMTGDFVDYDINGDGLLNEDDVQAILEYRLGEKEGIVSPLIADMDGDDAVDTYDAYLFAEALRTGMLSNGVEHNAYPLANELAALVIPVGGEYVTPDWAKPTNKPTKVSMSDETLEIIKGNSYQFSAFVLPWTVSDNSIDWTSSNEAVATVDGNGLLTAVGEGECKITAASHLDPTVKAEVSVNVNVIKETIAGALQNVDNNPMLYKWDLEGDGWVKGADLDFSITSMTQSKDGDLYIMDAVQDVYNMHLVDVTSGDQIAFGVNTTTFPMWDLAYSEKYSTEDKPLVMGIYGSYMLGLMDPMNVSTLGWDFGLYLMLFGGAQYFTAITAVGEGQTVDDGTVIETEVYKLLDDAGNIWEIGVYPVEGGYAASFDFFPSDLELEYDFSYGVSYSSMVLGDDGNLYLSQFDGNTSNMYQITFDETTESYVSTYLGNVGDGVWPAGIYAVTANGASEKPAGTAKTDKFVLDGIERSNTFDKSMLQAFAATVEQADANSAEPTVIKASVQTITPVEASGENAKADVEAKEEKETTKPENTLSSRTSEKVMMADSETKEECSEWQQSVIDVDVYSLKDGGAMVESNNGLIVVAYDTAVLEPKDVNVKATYGSYRLADGAVVLGYVYPTVKGAPVATISFIVKDKNNLTVNSANAYYIERDADNFYAGDITDEVVKQIVAGEIDGVYVKGLIDTKNLPPKPSRPSSGGSSGGGGGGHRGSGSSSASLTISARSESGSTGWEAITNEINRMSAGSTIVVVMNDEHDVPATVFGALADHDVIMKASAGSSHTWIVDGAALKSVPTKSVDLGVRSVMVDIPSAAIEAVTGVKTVFNVNESGAFGFASKIMVDVGSANAGKTAKLYKYNATSSKLEAVSSATAASSGIAQFDNITSGGDYAVAVEAASGDVNGDGQINALDASDILKASVGLVTLAHPENGDVTGDGKIDAFDAVWLLKKSAGLN